MYAMFFLSLCVPFWEEEFGWSHEGMGYATTVFSIVIGLGYIFGGIFVAKYGARRSILIGSFIIMGGFVILQFQSRIWHLYNIHRLAIIGFIPVVISVIILAFFQSLIMICLYAILIGIGFGINTVAMFNLLADYFGAKHYPKILGYFSPGWTILANLGAPLTGHIYDKTQSYEIAWQIFMVLLIIALVCLIFAKPPVHPFLKKGAEGVPIEA